MHISSMTWNIASNFTKYANLKLASGLEDSKITTLTYKAKCIHSSEIGLPIHVHTESMTLTQIKFGSVIDLPFHYHAECFRLNKLWHA